MKLLIKPRSQAGFSLVEVTLAVAIAALAIITLLGLLPQGLEMARKTALMINDSNILAQVTHDMENAAFDKLPTSIVKKYYNDQGREVQQDATDLAFVVEIEPQQVVALPKAEKTQPYMRRMVIRIAASSTPGFVFGTDNAPSYVTFNQLIAKTR
ncbi:MAG: Verru_Chthon cassette protein B [Prosthecobacter sp.]|uniref:Verru_Chthon cassette protein B n=1 Tax=Prosthecobacter sp. TaxID=1965333 RepID=UPI0025FE2B31|nr:Verru_Chthon cassette protein B [Prosthecobacter sp.]MCF7784690.1 Verru_Chthon cassette protein B [Prosthecobacter sp.]